MELPTTVETVEAAIKKHKEFSMAMELNLHRIKAVIEAGESLISQNNIYSERIRDRVDLLITRSDSSNKTPNISMSIHSFGVLLVHCGSQGKLMLTITWTLVPDGLV